MRTTELAELVRRYRDRLERLTRMERELPILRSDVERSTTQLASALKKHAEASCGESKLLVVDGYLVSLSGDAIKFHPVEVMARTFEPTS